MITRLLPEDIAKYWGLLREGIMEALPPATGENPEKMSNIFSSLLAGGADCWLVTDGKKVKGFAITTINEDLVSGTKNLLIYCLYGYGGMTGDGLVEGFEVISKYAKHRGCSGITAFTDVDLLIKIAEKFGGESKYKLIYIPI